MNILYVKLESWKKQLLDIGKRNRLINFKETKRSNITITKPFLGEIYQNIVLNEKTLRFPFPKKITFSDEGEEIIESIVEGDFETNKTINELQKTLKALRLKAKTSIEEQGINTLYLTFGLIKWTEADFSSQIISSPIILVPVSLTIESISSPFVLQLQEDEIVINPTLLHKFENDFGIKLPEFDSLETNIDEYLKKIQKNIDDKSWKVVPDVNLTILSFLKINMYKDLEKSKEKITNNAIISAIAGDQEFMSLPNEYKNVNHDKLIRPIESYQVVDADSSQQDAILLANKGISFVLQGPPGTGKSQTITNIISESLAHGKKILFVSEKMAALQVVHKRLTQSGLSDFVLTLHSHKANKKEILKELDNTINLNKIKIRDEAIYQLNTLQHNRDKLNAYSTELHTITQPLDKTIYEINGKIAALSNVPEVIFSFENAHTTSKDQLLKYIYLLDEFSKTIGKMSEDYSTNPWRNSIAVAITHELRHDIESTTKKLLLKLNEIAVMYSKVIDEFNIELPISFDNIENLIEILKLAGTSIKAPKDWIKISDNSNLVDQANHQKKIQQQYQSHYRELEANHNLSVFELNAKEIAYNIENSLQELKQLLNTNTYGSSNDIVTQITSITEEANAIADIVHTVKNKSDEIALLLGVGTPETSSSVEELQKILTLILQKPNPTLAWFEYPVKEILDFLDNFKEIHNDLSQLITQVSKKYSKEIFEIDSVSIRKRFNTEYNSFTKYFKAQYRSDKKQILALATTVVKRNNDDAIINLLNDLKLIREKEDYISSNREKLQLYFGDHYKGKETNWEKLSESINIFNQISTSDSGNLLSDKFKEFLLSKNSNWELIKSAEPILKKISDAHILSRLNLLFKNSGNEITFKQLEVYTKLLLTSTNTITEDYYKFIALSNQKTEYDTTLKNLSMLVEVQTIANDIALQKDRLEPQFGYLYSGLTTDWDVALKILSYCSKFNDITEKYNLPISFVENIYTDNNTIVKAKEMAQAISEKHAHLLKDFNWFTTLFEKTETFELLNFYKVIERIERCLSSISLLEEWIDFRSNRMNCITNGLASYVEAIEQIKISPNLITNTFLKRFYRLWLDATIPNFPSVNSFRRNAFEATINEFKSLDTSQLTIARSRVRERLISNLPDLTLATTSRDEVGILKRELNKQRKLLPLRKLFNAIPNLLTSLKPCLMMSPLSVSVFLEADSYDFDIVIFDEASQVRTEDAVGAIMRGKQVIIVGDNKQLPPTNFFATTNLNEDFDSDNDDENEDINAYESILDEALKSVPEISLKWHYRSRHEHLIAFSNAKIYNHNLITFPSNIDKVKDNGVEYIYVQNGVYDRGGKTHNINEAKRIAELVFEHIKKQPKRSLGVVTFSEAQQLAVDSAISQLRIENPHCEYFFSEEKEEAFFIKNLENVQGDERDTIIFSIGYAKDANGVMYMNFGPLGKPGGHRRLNVAITRAKYNVKLVGSIQPTDINLEKVNAEGVKMLRSYIDFAINGATAIQNELKYNESVVLESPFEESVYDFLLANGYNVATQIGCSGYRIDMAVKHPTLSGVFVLGVECDGATYHSSRTARERDRLRQTVLEDIGWKIYRIWSTDWIKDPITEGQNLIRVVDKALSSFSLSSLSFIEEEETISNITETVFSSSTIETEIIKPINENVSRNNYNFVDYIEADIKAIDRYNDPINYYSHVIKHVIQKEYPIHFENLCKRVAPLFGNQKATQKVINSVSQLLNGYLKNEIVQEDDFLSPKNVEFIFVRIPTNKDNIRPIHYISSKELAEAMLSVAKKSYGIKPDDLYIKTAREFGYNRSGANITQAFQKAYLSLLKSGKIKEVDENKVIVM